MVSRPGNLEMLGNFVALERSQGILPVQNEHRRSFFKIHSSGEQDLVMPVHISSMLMDFYLRIKMNLNC